MRKFYVGEKVIGNKKASCYSITCPGWVGTVIAVKNGTTITVQGVDRNWEVYDVNEAYFDSLVKREPKRNEEGKAICEDCGKPIENEDEIEWVNGRAICKDCVEKNYSVCPFCGEIYPNEEFEEIDEVKVCSHCAEIEEIVFTCQNCGERHLRSINNYGYVPDLGLVCEKCIGSGDFVRCDDCGRWFRKGDVVRSRRDGHMRCADCERSLKAKCIKEYGYKPDPVFKQHNCADMFSDNGIKELLFGVELEIDKGENREDCAEELLNTSPDIYCKRDGSLSNGIEIVSHPCTLGYHKEDLGWDKLSEVALKYEFRSQEARTCGLHVHVGRRQMGKNKDERLKTAAKIVLLADRHWNSLVKFSRRKPEQLERWAARPEVDYEGVADGYKTLADAALATKRQGRYQAVNLENCNTVEFRLFNGTLKVDTIFATLELVSRIVTYAKDKTEEECMLSSWGDIVGGNLIDNAENKELTEYLETRGITEGEAPTEYEWKAPETEKFSVGDKIVVINNRGKAVSKLSAHIGEVAAISYVHEGAGRGDYAYDIDFGDVGYGLHNCGGRLPRATGYMVYAKNIKRYEEE